ncbi:MAG: LysR family transcriptional regulator, glycine cleavage system transcriptional activator [Saliniramus fredricksonii]|uniref:LysR family transcriptional regulator, glycine cleavage system transcriptional activator n=1 Tax=Saliniramus fredricksonii TaxID=1653334 RepID=A0A0P7XW00_9HYPH|nr:LysR substrate-binding domain-containing protein [Saliniramus fredricksonii]KPQ11726.1 MAG: LysR family transcriptional regulator, glycine cleavage system transcriptional activator [Saliniramus fredricksonii]SCC80187.1 LysR family transcriptional regulator, glycine cleavage system transcriptional activator [Saliniramus fredricksonii]
MRQLPILRALQTFEAAARYPSFSAAAAALGMTHGAISHQIRALEDWLGKKVFDRRGNGVVLNADGQRLYQVCSQSFSMLEQEVHQIRTSTHEPVLSIGCSTTLLSYWLLPRIDKFLEAKPDVSLRFQTRSDISALTSRYIDVLITSDPVSPLTGIHATRLGNARIGPVCAPDRCPIPRQPHDITDMPLLHASSRLDAWEEWADEAGIGLRKRKMLIFETLSLSIEAACSGLGFAMTPDFVVRSELERGRLIAPLGFLAVERTTWLYMRESDTQSGSVPAFRNWLIENAALG